MPKIISTLIPLWDGVDTDKVKGQRIFESAALELALKELGSSAFACYHCNGDWQDASASPKHGSPGGGATFDSVDKKLGSHSGAFDGTSGAYVLLGNESQWDGILNGTSPASLSFWAKGLAAGDAVFSKGDDPAFFGMYTSAGDVLMFEIKRGSNGDKLAVSASVFDAGWTHVAVTYDGSRTAAGVKFYKNASLRSNTVISDTLSGPVENDAPVYIGKGIVGGWELSGRLDEFSVFDRVLTGEEITEIYNGGAGREEIFYPTDSPSPNAVWASLPVDAAVDMSSIHVPENMNSGDSGSIEYAYAANGNPPSPWMTQAALRLQPDVAIADPANSFKLIPRYVSNGAQRPTSRAYARIEAELRDPASKSRHARALGVKGGYK